MAVRFFTQGPSALLKLFEAKISQEEREGSITTWRKTKSGNFTHKSERWGGKAFFKPNTSQSDRLRFNIIPLKGEKIDPEVYSYYHAHLIETFLNHFPEKFTLGVATSTPTKHDVMISKKS